VKNQSDRGGARLCGSSNGFVGFRVGLGWLEGWQSSISDLG
jgi:hypothetical protein